MMCLFRCLKMGIGVAILLFLAVSPASASVPIEISLRDLACGADHVFVGRVTGVDMINKRGRIVRNEKARTGPGLGNLIRLDIEVLEVIDSTAPSPLPSLKMPLDPMMHFSLGQIRAAHAEPSSPQLVFLRGAAFEPIVAGRFLWTLDAREEALALRSDCHAAHSGNTQ